jgi:hypothetical protein
MTRWGSSRVPTLGSATTLARLLSRTGARGSSGENGQGSPNRVPFPHALVSAPRAWHRKNPQ